MADTVTGPTILQQNDKRVVIKIVNQSDGTGSTTVFVAAVKLSTSVIRLFTPAVCAMLPLESTVS